MEIAATKPFDPEFFKMVEAEAYELARRRTELTGITWEVDHIVPLKSHTVCGLHNEYNLAVITKAQNSKKRNWHWPDKP